MLISRVPDEGGERGGDEGHLQTASQLFDLITGDRDFDAGKNPFTTSDLVLLYKNLDLGKQVMSNAGEVTPRSNQHVETVVWRDEVESDSELSESYSSEQLEHVALVNQERLDLLAGNTLCHKLGDLELHSGATTDYNRHFLFKDPYIKEQIKNLKLVSSSCEDSAVLPASLLDYICCRRLEDNYSFYMDNIIRYVKNTIEQLKRISNGDYLTDRAKQKWREVEKKNPGDGSKVLTGSTSIPLHVERKLYGAASTWDDLVHSEVDLRSLAKILEKKIVVEVPKLISGSYKLFSSRTAENLVVRCARAPAPAARVDVVLQLQRCAAGRVGSNIDSILILQSELPANQIDNTVDLSCKRSSKHCHQVSNAITFPDSTELLPLTYPKTEHKNEKEKTENLKEDSIKITEREIPKIIEIQTPMIIEEETPKFIEIDTTTIVEEETPKLMELTETEPFSARDSLLTDTDRECRSRRNELNEEWSSSREHTNGEAENLASLCEPLAAAGGRATRIVRGEAALNLATPEDMRLTLQPLARQPPQPDDTTDDSYSRTKKKSPTRVRIKSPYENKSHIIEERKRRRLLEVRERRERRKMAMNEHKSSRNKFCKSAIAPQASSSVTKLSITNKSFYNSIFGQNNGENKPPLLNNAMGRKGQKKDDAIPEMVLEQPEGERDETASVESDRGQKFINRSYYLDDTVTEMMYQQMKRAGDGDKTSASTSAVSNDSGANQGSLSLLSSASFTNPETRAQSSNDNISPEKDCTKDFISRCSRHLVPGNIPKESPGEPAVECRRSIEKIYVLMKKLGKIEPKQPRAPSSGDGADPPDMQTDSGTSLQHRLASSNPSTFSFGKPVNEEYPKDEPTSPRSKELSSRAVVPKVIIGSKQRLKPELEKPIRVHGRAPQSPRVKTFPDNPLKAISQLLHEFDHVQKARQKAAVESKQGKKEGAPTDASAARREAVRRRAAEAAEARGAAGRGPPALAQPRRSHPRPLEEPRHPRPRVPERAARPPAAPRAPRGPGAAPAPVPSERGARGPRPAAGGPTPRAPPAGSAPRASPAGPAPRPPPSGPAPRAPPAAPRALKKKMVAVESYVQQHYARGAGAAAAGPAPLLPSDCELSSMTSSPMPEESSALGTRLHRLIDTILRAPPPRAASPPPPEHAADARGDFPEQPQPDTSEPRGSELALLDNAPSRKISAGAFSAHLRIKNLKLSPKHSLQRIVLLKSGDAASLLLESKLSRSFPSNTSTSSSDDLDFTTLPLSVTRLDWKFTQLPMQISTVGYAFPSYDRDCFAKATPINIVDIDTIVTRKVLNESDEDNPCEGRHTRDQTCQCFKGISSEQALDCAVQAADDDFAAPAAGPAPPVSGNNNSPVNGNDTPPVNEKDTPLVNENEHHPVSEYNPMDPKLDPPKMEMVDDKQPISEVEVSPKDNTGKIEITDSSEVVGEKSEMLDYTTSLDILVSLVNEIQKITSYSCESEEAASARPSTAPSRATSKEAKSESRVGPVNPDPAGARKETVDASTSEMETSAGEQRACASKAASAPVRAPRGLAGVAAGASRVQLHAPAEPALSASSLAEYRTPCTISTAEIDRHLPELPSAPNPGYVKSLVIFHDAHAAKIKNTEVTDICKNVIKRAVVRREKSASDFVTNTELVLNQQQRKKNLDKCCLDAADYDPMIKMKRDILVTMYSFLVLTVFAALSLPELLLHT